MIRINLLPHREQKRRERRQAFFVLIGVVAGATAAVALAVHLLIAGQIDAQQQRNDFIKQKNAELDKQIAEIKRLREQIDALLARKQVIESLQTNRVEAVQLFNELVRQMPEGVFLRSMKQNGTELTFVGYAQSNARVSTLMRNLDSAELLGRPQLVEVKAGTVNNRRVAEFTLKMQIERARPEADDPNKIKAKGA